MKKKLAFLAALFLAGLVSGAQNLVLNNSLDNYITCPGFGQFGPAWINGWTKPSWGSSDYYHINCAGIVPPPPGPHSGNGEAGIILYNFGTEYREYITGTFSQPLVAGQQYLVEFYVCLNSGYIQAVQEAGAFISDSVPGPFSNSLSIPVVPQVKNNNGFLSYGWQKVSGYFTAAGGENYVTIGNFNNDSNTTIQQVGTSGSYGAYYFVDDVYVGLSDSASAGIVPVPSDNKISLIPNPVSLEEPLFFNRILNQTADLYWYDVTGRQAGYTTVQAGERRIFSHPQSAGFYFYELRTNGLLPTTGKLLIRD